MKNHIKVLAILLLFTFTNSLFAISPSVKSAKDYTFTLSTLRSLKIMVENFPEDGIKEKYDEVLAMFREASENYYGQDFTKAHIQYKNVKKELMDLVQLIAKKYLDRTKEILDSTSKDAFDILIEYSRESGKAAYFRQPFDPLNDVKSYDPATYHFFFDRETIERYLKTGYEQYQSAKRTYENPELDIIKERKRIQSDDYNFIISHYTSVIERCRLGKQYGIEIHRIINNNELGEILRQYKLNGEQLSPIFDDRIPSSYKVDANDNLRLIHAVEIQRWEKNQGKEMPEPEEKKPEEDKEPTNG